jgi:hypothetical protein
VSTPDAYTARCGPVDFHGQPYALYVVVPTREDDGETPENWAAAGHRRVEVCLWVNPDRHRTPADKLAAYQWAANTQGRIGVMLQVDIYRRELGHWCSNDPMRYRCGLEWSEGVDEPWWTVDTTGPVSLGISVPTPRVLQWAEHSERRIAELLAADQRPLDTPGADGDHQAVVNLQPADPRSVPR